MAKNFTFTVEGGSEVAAKLKALGNEAEGVLVEAVTAGAELMRRAASANASQISQELSENIVLEQRKTDGETVTLAIGPDEDRFWGMFWEFGADSHGINPDSAKALQFINRQFAARVERHPGIPETPWLTPAFEETKTAAEQAIAEALRKALL